MTQMFNLINEKFEFWRRRLKYRQNKHFKISMLDSDIPSPPTTLFEAFEWMRFELISGKFKGTVYRYKNIIHADDKLSYKIDIYGSLNDDHISPELNKTINQVLLSTIENYLEHNKLLLERIFTESLKDEEVGKDYIEEPTLKRTVRKEGSSLPKKRVSTRAK